MVRDIIMQTPSCLSEYIGICIWLQSMYSTINEWGTHPLLCFIYLKVFAYAYLRQKLCSLMIQKCCLKLCFAVIIWVQPLIATLKYKLSLLLFFYIPEYNKSLMLLQAVDITLKYSSYSILVLAVTGIILLQLLRYRIESTVYAAIHLRITAIFLH